MFHIPWDTTTFFQWFLNHMSFDAINLIIWIFFYPIWLQFTFHLLKTQCIKISCGSCSNGMSSLLAVFNPLNFLQQIVQTGLTFTYKLILEFIQCYCETGPSDLMNKSQNIIYYFLVLLSPLSENIIILPEWHY